MARDWEAIQTAYLVSLSRTNMGWKWINQLVKKVFLISWDMWDCCNHTLHRGSLASLECLSGEINSTIHRLLTTHHWQLLPQDRYRLETADSDILNQDLATRQLWIVSFEWAKDHFKSAAQQSLRSH